MFSEKRGVFVTLNLARAAGERLRGCIGFPYPVKQLAEGIGEAAAMAATEDPRFEPVSEGELRSIVVEVSVLTIPRRLNPSDRRGLPSKVEIGRDGLIVSNRFTSGLLLPQVATDFRMDATEFLSQACMKAGLTPDSWLDKEVEVDTFQADIFAEVEPSGEVRRVRLRES